MLKKVLSLGKYLIIPVIAAAFLALTAAPALASTCTTTNSTNFDVTACIDAPASNPATLSGNTTVTGSYNSLTLRNGATLSRLEFRYTPPGGSEITLASMFGISSGSPATFTWHTDDFIDMTSGTLSLYVVTSMSGAHTDSSPATQTVTLSNSNSVAPTNTNTFTPVAPAYDGSPMIMAVVGDGASNEANPETVANLMDSWNPEAALYLGDVYYKGTHEEFQNFYESTFGVIKDVTNPVIGNHEYIVNNSGTGYMWYWNNAPNYYSYDAGGWHFIALNTNYTKIATTTNNNSTFSNGGAGGVGTLTDSSKNWRTNQWVNQTVTVGSETHYIASNNATTLTLKTAWSSIPSSNSSYTINGGKTTQQAWLNADLTANADKCIIAYSHHPRFSIGSHGSDIDQEEIWDSLVNNKATSYLVGHDHSYQRWTAMDGDAVATSSGVNTIVIGTGGHGSTSISGSDSDVISSIGGTAGYGAMKLAFHKSKYDFQFYKINDGSVFDSGSIKCQGRGALSGNVVDTADAAVAGVTVSWTGEASTGTVSGSTTTDSNGDWSAGTVASADYTVTFTKTGYITDDETAEVGGATTTDLADFELLSNSSVTGTVTDAGTSGAVEGATVTYPGGSTTTDSSGNYTISGQGTSIVPVTVTKSGYIMQMASVTTTAGTPATQNFSMPAVIFGDDFESGDLTSWTTNNNFVSQNTVKNTGTYAAQGNTTSAATNLRKTLASTYSNIYMRTYFNVNSQASGSGLGLLALRTSTDGAIMKVYIDGNNGKLCIRNEITLVNTCSNTVPTQDVWHSVELHAIINNTSSTHEVWYDGTADASLTSTSASLGVNNVGRVVLGEIQSGRTFDVFFDDVVVTNARANIMKGSITGTVTDSLLTSAVSGATVSYSGSSTTSLTNGAYTLVNVPLGTHEVTASKSGYTTQNNNVAVTTASGTTQNIALVPTTGNITGTVTDAASGNLSGITVSYSGGSTTTNGSGQYTVTGVTPGTYIVTAESSTYGPKQAVVTVTAGAAATQNFTLPLVVFRDDFESGNLNAWTTNNNFVNQGTTYHFGTKSAKAETTGSVAVNLRKTFGTTYAKGNYRASFYVDSQASGSSLSLVWFKNSTGGSLIKTYIDGNNSKLCLRNEVTGVNTCSNTIPTQDAWHTVELYAYVNGSSASEHKVWYDGVELTELTSTSANLNTDLIGRAWLGETTSGRTYTAYFDDVLIQTSAVGVPGGTITGTVTDAQSSATLGGATVSIPGKSVTADGSGVYTITDVAPGSSYTVTASKTNYTDNTATAYVVAGTSYTANIALTGSNIGSISGTVTDAGTGSAVSGVTVSYSGGNATTDGSGNYTISGVAVGTYDVTASKTGYTSKTTTGVSVTSGQATDVDFALPLLLHSDNFESNNFNAWTTNNNMTMQSTTVHGGSYAPQGNTDGSTAMNLRKTLGSTYQKAYFRTYFNVNSQAAASGLGLLALRTSSDGAIMKVYIDGNTNKLCIRNEFTSTNTCSNTVPSQDTWHSVELYADVNGTSSTHKVYYNGTEETSLTSTSANLGTNHIGRLVVGELNSGRTYDVFFDDVIAQNSYVGQ